MADEDSLKAVYVSKELHYRLDVYSTKNKKSMREVAEEALITYLKAKEVK